MTPVHDAGHDDRVELARGSSPIGRRRVGQLGRKARGDLARARRPARSAAARSSRDSRRPSRPCDAVGTQLGGRVARRDASVSRWSAPNVLGAGMRCTLDRACPARLDASPTSCRSNATRRRTCRPRRYLRLARATRAETIVVDGSPAEVFAAHAAAWAAHRRWPTSSSARRRSGDARWARSAACSPASRLASPRAGRHRRRRRAVRRGDAGGSRGARSTTADVVRPQNYFDPLPWHARWDTRPHAAQPRDRRRLAGHARACAARCCARPAATTAGAMFENLELVRTVLAAGGREAVLYDAVRAAAAVDDARTSGRSACARPTTSSRGRPARCAARPAAARRALALPPASLAALLGRRRRARRASRKQGAGAAAADACFPAAASLLRAALARRARGVHLARASARALLPRRRAAIAARVLRHAATPMRVLRARYATLRERRAAAASDAAARRRSA